MAVAPALSACVALKGGSIRNYTNSLKVQLGLNKATFSKEEVQFGL